MKTDFTELVESITTKEDFKGFVNLLIQHLETNPDDWENQTMESFLEAMWSYINDSNIDSKDWKFFAQILAASRIYE